MKIWTKKLKDSAQKYFGQCDDFIVSFWNFLMFITAWHLLDNLKTNAKLLQLTLKLITNKTKIKKMHAYEAVCRLKIEVVTTNHGQTWFPQSQKIWILRMLICSRLSVTFPNVLFAKDRTWSIACSFTEQIANIFQLLCRM